MKTPGTGTFIKAGLVSLALLGLLAYRLWDYESLKTVLGGCSFFNLGLAAAIYLLAPLGRAWRFCVLLGKGPASLAEMFKVAALHQAGLRLLPVRTGEALFPYLYGKAFESPLGDGVAGLIYARLMDLAGLALVFLASLYWTSASARVPLSWPLWAAALVAAMVAVSAALPFFLSVVARLCSGRAKGGGRLASVLGKAASIASDGERAAREIRTFPRLLAASLATLLVWAGVFGCFWALMRPYSMSWPDVVLGGTAASIAGSMPVGGIGNIGPQEAGWTLGFTLAGMTPSAAFTTGVLANFFTLVMSLAIGAVCLASTKLSTPGNLARLGKDQDPRQDDAGPDRLEPGA